MTVQELYTHIGGSYDSAKKILQMDKLISKFILKFLDDKSCQRLMDARSSGDSAAMFEGAHALKGVCANLGLNSLSEKASEIAEEFRPGHSRSLSDDELNARLNSIQSEYDSIIAGIAQFKAEQA